MRAAVLSLPKEILHRPLQVKEISQPVPAFGQVLLRVRACGICRTDLHIVEGELAQRRPRLIPGHQIVGEVAGGATPDLPLGTRVGVCWIAGTDGDCWYCRHGRENLCDALAFTDYTVDGCCAEYTVARNDFVFPLPKLWTTIMPRRSYAPGSSASAVCGWRKSTRVQE
jgi:propanol-preferring alcohol dehydrogenase